MGMVYLLFQRRSPEQDPICGLWWTETMAQASKCESGGCDFQSRSLRNWHLEPGLGLTPLVVSSASKHCTRESAHQTGLGREK